MTPKVLTEDQLRDVCRMDLEALAAVEKAFTWLAEGRASMPPVMHVSVGEAGDVDVKSAYVAGEPSFAVKIASGFFGNAARGLATGSGLVVVLSAETGFCQAVLLDNGYLTDLRTALAGAVAARHLAPVTVTTAGVLGAGVQAGMQLEALRLVRPFQRLLVWARDPGKAQAFRRRMEVALGCLVEVTPRERVIEESDCLVTTTPSREPLVEGSAVRPGQHITAMGSDLPSKGELAPEVLTRAELVVCDTRSQSRRIGELQGAPEGLATVELGEITAGRHPGRTTPKQLTVCDLTGTGVQDTAIALYALRRAAGL